MFCVLFLCSCAAVSGFLETGGRVLDGSVFEYTTNIRWKALSISSLEVRNISLKDGTKEIVFSTPDIPYLVFFGTPPLVGGSFNIKRVHFLAGNYGGWNEFDIESSGIARLRILGNDNAAFTLLSSVELHSIIGGKIRRDYTRLSGERALEELRNRGERITFLVDWMKSFPGAPASFSSQDEFEFYWQPRLFPKKESARDLILPEELISLRQSGTLEADWNEAAAWIRMIYDWNTLISILNQEVILTKVK